MNSQFCNSNICFSYKCLKVFQVVAHTILTSKTFPVLGPQNNGPHLILDADGNLRRMVYQKTVNKPFCNVWLIFLFQDSRFKGCSWMGCGGQPCFNHTITVLSTNEIAEILRLYSCLRAIDQSVPLQVFP